MQDFAAITDTLMGLEDEFDVQSLRFSGLMVWPAIKIRIRKHLLHPKFNDMNRDLAARSDDPETAWPSYARRTFGLGKDIPKPDKALELHRAQLARLGRDDDGRPRAMFFSRPQQHQTVDGLLYSPHLDSMNLMLRTLLSPVKIELPGPKTMRGEYVIPPLRPDHGHLIAALLGGRMADEFDDTEDIQGFDDLFQTMERMGMDVFFTHRSMRNMLLGMKALALFFTDMLKAMSASAVFLVCYHDPEGMALSAACRELGIGCMDIQHGTVHNEPAYVSWKNVPEGGWPHLPDSFLTWGEEFARGMNRVMPQDCSHKALVVGNLWISSWKNRVFPKNPVQWPSPSDAGPQGTAREILFTLDPIENPIPKHVLQSMRGPGPYRWLLRLHPTWLDERARILALLEREGIENFELEAPTRAPLYSLLEKVDAHVTCSSSTCFEALAWDVPSVIVHERGRILHGHFIDKGVFTFAGDEESLERALETAASAHGDYQEVVKACDADELARRMRGVLEID